MNILGISAHYHDSAAAIIVNGEVVAAVQEERFTRKKHDRSFPVNSIRYCLDHVGIELCDVKCVAFYEQPLVKFDRILKTYLAYAPRGFQTFAQAMPVWIKNRLFARAELLRDLRQISPGVDADRIFFAEHHQSHAAAAFFPSPFEEALILTIDGVGEWSTTSAYIGRANKLELLKKINFPHSIGLLYSTITAFLGFKVNSGEYKVMGLAPYGTPRYANLIKKHLIDLLDDGSFRLNMDYFDFCIENRMANEKLHHLFDMLPRESESPLTQQHMDIAASVQSVIEDAVLSMARSLQKETGLENLCMAGGVALNCVANGKIVREKIFANVWVQPAAGDAGGALGAGLAAYYQYHKRERKKPAGKDAMKGGYLGPSYTQSEIERRLAASGAVFDVLNIDDVIMRTSEAIAEQKVVGWFQGRMEFGPRALGARSILGDARSESMQKTMNLKIKFRESFRPFAPSVLEEDVSEFFDIDCMSPYMLLVAPLRTERRLPVSEDSRKLLGIELLNVKRSVIPAVTHVDYSARIQTVSKDTNEIYHRLLADLRQRIGVPVCINTSFNIRGEPIVNSPEDAFRCFMGTNMDLLVIGNCILEKGLQDMRLAKDYKGNFDPD